jgi:hypothetical protein
MWTFNGFGAYAIELKKRSFALPKAVKMSMHSIGLFVQEIIRSKHWVRQPGRPTNRLNPTPLVKSWDLREAVSYRIHEGTNMVELYSKKSRLAVIHEYGATRKMTEKQRKRLFANVFNDPSMKKPWRPRGEGWYIRIPARPIWRVVLKDKIVHSGVVAITERAVKTVFNK